MEAAEKALEEAKRRGAEAAKIRELEENLAREKREAEEAAALAEKERIEAEEAERRREQLKREAIAAALRAEEERKEAEEAERRAEQERLEAEEAERIALELAKKKVNLLQINTDENMLSNKPGRPSARRSAKNSIYKFGRQPTSKGNFDKLDNFEDRFGGVLEGVAQTTRGGSRHFGFGARKQTVKKLAKAEVKADVAKDYDNEEDSGYGDEYDNEDYGSEGDGEIEVKSFFYWSMQPHEDIGIALDPLHAELTNYLEKDS